MLLFDVIVVQTTTSLMACGEYNRHRCEGKAHKRLIRTARDRSLFGTEPAPRGSSRPVGQNYSSVQSTTREFNNDQTDEAAAAADDR
jgi:hypothetical protein